MDKSDQKRPRADFGAPTDEERLDLVHVEALAHRVAELLRDEARETAGRRLVDAATLATELGVERSWVYEHANELQPIRLGNGPKAPLRFDVLAVRAAFATQNLTEPRSRMSVEETNGGAPARRARRGSRPKPTVGRVLAVRPRDAS